MAIVDNHPHVDVTVRHDDVNDSSCCPAFFPNRSENGVVNMLTEVDALNEFALHSKEFGLRNHSKDSTFKDDWNRRNVMTLHQSDGFC